ncbi:MAG TPA: transporter [Cyanobacteria bacterium UBA8803]|nr:transporter [Cyanobacteria bacterium UBA9273]HBL57773.1 transporter [Cyanobacteria bacterium UBA8803]
MQKLTTFLLTGVLVFGAVACANNPRTSADAPNTTAASPEAPETDEAQDSQKDAQSQVRRDQLNSDIRAREERNNAVNQGSAEARDDDDIASEVRSKLEANIPASQLTVDAEDGVIVVAGTVPTQEQLAKIETLAKEIKGVKSVNVKATVAPAKPEQKDTKGAEDTNKQGQ